MTIIGKPAEQDESCVEYIQRLMQTRRWSVL